MGFYGVSMGFYGVSMGFYGVLWGSMGFYGVKRRTGETWKQTGRGSVVVGLSVNFSWISCSYQREMEAVAKIDMSLGKIVFWFILYSVYLRFTRIPMDSETSKSFSYFEEGPV